MSKFWQPLMMIVQPLMLDETLNAQTDRSEPATNTRSASSVTTNGQVVTPIKLVPSVMRTGQAFATPVGVDWMTDAALIVSVFEIDAETGVLILSTLAREPLEIDADIGVLIFSTPPREPELIDADTPRLTLSTVMEPLDTEADTPRLILSTVIDPALMDAESAFPTLTCN